MNDTLKTETANPPRLIASLTSGFNHVAGRIYLILLPVGVDLLLWFGPRFRLKTLMQPAIQDWLRNVQALGGREVLGDVSGISRLWETMLERFNLLSLLSSLPVGVPSLLAGWLPLQNPLGEPQIVEVSNWQQAITGWLLFGLLGLAAGSLYFSMVARSTASPSEGFSLSRSVWETGQLILMVSLLIIFLILMCFPLMIVSFVLALINPGLTQLALFLMVFVLLWLLIPLVFSPHGIFASRLNVLRAMVLSTRMMRLLFPGVGLFLLAVLVLSQGMSYLWHIPPETSWLMLAGILGNAFVSTALLAASFIYYRGALNWVESVRRNLVR